MTPRVEQTAEAPGASKLWRRSSSGIRRGLEAIRKDSRGREALDTFPARGGKIGIPGARNFSFFSIDLVDIGMPIAIISGYLRDRIFPQRFCPSKANNVGTIVMLSLFDWGPDLVLG
jgi:hypothetical protein